MGIRESQQVWELIDRRCWWSQLWVGMRAGRDVMQDLSAGTAATIWSLSLTLLSARQQERAKYDPICPQKDG